MQIDWDTVDWGLVVSVAVAIGAFIGWFDNRRRTKALERRTSVVFQIDRDTRFAHGYLLRNVGDRKAENVRIDGNSVASFKVNRLVFLSLEPNESGLFMLETSETARPDTIRVTWTRPFKGSQQVIFPTTVEVPEQ